MKLRTLVPKVAAVVAVGSYLMLGTHPVKAGVVSPLLAARQSQALNALRPLPLYWGGFSSAFGGNTTGLLWGAALGAAAGAFAAASNGYFAAADDSGDDTQAGATFAYVAAAATFDGSSLPTLTPNTRALD